MRVSDQLRAAKDLTLSRRATGSFARRADGAGTSIQSPEACAFCSAGAVVRVTGASNISEVLGRYDGNRPVPAMRYLMEAAKDLVIAPVSEYPETNVYIVHDHHPSKVPEMFDRAIRLAEAEEGTQC